MPLEFFESLGDEFATIEEKLGHLMKILNAKTDAMKNAELSQEQYEDLLYETRNLRETMNAVHEFVRGSGVIANILEPSIEDPYQHQEPDPLNLNYDPESAFAEQKPYIPEESLAAQEGFGEEHDDGGAPVAA